MDKVKLLDVMSKVKKEFGEDAICLLGSSMDKYTISRWSTGIPDFDAMIGGGMPKSRIVELWGPEQSGKTSLAYKLASQVEFSVFIDAEGSFDVERARLFGVKDKRMIVNRPEDGEEAAKLVVEFTKVGVPLVIVDSVPGLVPSKGMDLEKDSVSPTPRLLSKLFRVLMPVLMDSETTVLFINQVRDRIGILFGDQYTTPGGHALKHYTSLRIETRRKEWVKRGEKRIGQICSFRVTKSKVSKPYQTCEVPLIFDRGFVTHEELKAYVKGPDKKVKA